MVLKQVASRLSNTAATTTAPLGRQSTRLTQTASVGQPGGHQVAGRGPTVVVDGDKGKPYVMRGPYKSLIAGVIAGTAVGAGYLTMKANSTKRTGLLH